MIVSWNWLQQYVKVDLSHEEVVHRLTMSGLNHEETKQQSSDLAIDLEVTSNRPDCLGHIGIAREIAVLCEQELHVPQPAPAESSTQAKDLTDVRIESPELCRRYTARVIRGVKIGPSPSWLVERLETIGIHSVNNVVDVTNYVMMECGQPLHAFDFAKLRGASIIVRRAAQGEELVAIDHKTYQLDTDMCVIADRERPIAIAGVMGGAETEVSERTTDLLIEVADFAPLAIRHAARKLNLQSPSSYRFERTVDPNGIDWASRRCCELILQTAGGELAGGVVDVGESIQQRSSVVLRLAQIKRVLGVEVPSEKVTRILAELGNQIVASGNEKVEVIPPSWRRDLMREIDLIEEVARIHGYDQIPENTRVPMAATMRKDDDRATAIIRNTLVAAGFYEAMTTSLVPEKWSAAFSPWSDAAPLTSSQPMLGVLEKASQNIGSVDLVRRSLIPSLLEARRVNEHRSNVEAHLFEIAKVYLAKGDGLPSEELKIAVVGSLDFYGMKGLVETIIRELNSDAALAVDDFSHPLLDVTRCCGLRLNGKRLGWLGEVSRQGKNDFNLRKDVAVVEIDLKTLIDVAVLIPQQKKVSEFPAISRDFNFVVSEQTRWEHLESTVRQSGGALVESVRYVETFRDAKKDGAGKKRILLSVTLRSPAETLTGTLADEICGNIVKQCERDLQAALVA